MSQWGDMATLDDLRQRLRRPLELEQHNGYSDSAVVGGIERLLETLGNPFADVQTVMSHYAEANPEERAEKIERALELLTKTPAHADIQSPSLPQPNEQSSIPSFSVEQLDTPLENAVLNLGAQASKKLAGIGINSYRDLLFYYPKRYEDRRTLPSFAALSDDKQVVTVSGVVTGRKAAQSKRGMSMLRVFLEDQYGGKLTAIWFNQPWLEKQFYPNQRVIATGRLKRKGRWYELNVSEFEIDDDGANLSMGRIVSVYASTQGLSQAYIRRAVFRLLENLETVPDHLPRRTLEQEQLISLNRALRQIHFPDDDTQLQTAIRRLKFDEFLFLELRLLLNRDTSTIGQHFKASKAVLQRFYQSLPFTLTEAQQRALDDILADMRTPKQMARLLQGDVGSGKTVVAAAAIYVVTQNGAQAALMAPTEVLARQHYTSLRSYLYPLGVRLELLVGGMSKKQADTVRQLLVNGEVDVVIGTQALIQEGVTFKRLGLAVIDEEHRFGVEQRRKLLAGLPDVLVMSATPIPRSLALTLYGDLDLSTIDALPPGRKPITTKLMSDAKRRDVYRFAWGEIQKGRQVYVVTPLIADSEAEVMAEVVSAEQMYSDLLAIMPPACRIALLHGKMSTDEKEQVMQAFRCHHHDLLVATTVIEVGVDIPNASLIIIENAERFGLSQLHQLRGRVGRGKHESYCILIAGDRSKKTQQRLEVIAKYQDGFMIAEKDLALRGPGEMRGTRQSGMPDLILGDLAQDGAIIERARELAKKMLLAAPQLNTPWASRLKAELQRRAEYIGFREII